MEYLKVWTTFGELLEELTDAECGRLFKAMLVYAATGEQLELSGNERYVWPAARQSINNTRDKSEQAKANGSKPKQTEAKGSEPKQNEAKPSRLFDKEKEKDKDKYIKSAKALSPRESDRLFDKFWSVYPRHEGKQDARKAWDKLKADEPLLETIISAIMKQKQSVQWQEPRYIPHPATWLNGRRWEDEPATKPAQPRVLRAQDYEQREYHESEMAKVLGVDDMFTEVAG